MKIYDTALQELREFQPIEDNKVKMYVCGPTVYDFAHLGHARCYITWDTVVRYLRFKGYDVTYARNITDVDDKIINKAKKENTTPLEIATKFYSEFRKDMADLNVADPDLEPKATENIQAIVDIIQTLIDKGFAYEAEGDVYYRVNKYTRYGKLSHQNIDDLRSGARVELSEKKEDPLDFALWKAVKELDELGWESPWGKGRPGWHIECSAMVKSHLGASIDIHAGGQDLIFPHHENEMAQSEAALGAEFAKYWMHNGFVIINAEKMSKSLGNFVTIRDILEKYDANSIRLFILTNHYRMPIEFADEGLKSAKAGAARLKNAVVDAAPLVAEEKEKSANEALEILVRELVKEGVLPLHEIDRIPDLELKKYSEEAIDFSVKAMTNFVRGMDDDFNTSKALAVLFDIAGQTQKTKDRLINGEDNDKLSCDIALYVSMLLKLSSILGFKIEKEAKLGDELASKLMDIIISVRATARTQKNWEISDKIRDELKEAGIALKDNKDGSTTWGLL